MNRHQGTVKWFSRDKGWGFLRLEDGSEVFVHHTDIEGEGHRTLEDDEPVEFSVEQMEKGPRARNVRRLGSDARPEKSITPPKDEESRSIPLADQLRRRLSRLFPGIGG